MFEQCSNNVEINHLKLPILYYFIFSLKDHQEHREYAGRGETGGSECYSSQLPGRGHLPQGGTPDWTALLRQLIQTMSTRAAVHR